MIPLEEVADAPHHTLDRDAARDSFSPLGVLGYCLTRTHFPAPVLKNVRLLLKTIIHPPESKLLDVLVSILSGCRAIGQVNTRL
jgi:hypothetical protein